MFDDKNMNRDDALSRRLERLSGQVKPSPALMKAAKTGVPLRAAGIRYTAGTHIRRVSKAVLAYAAGVALFLGAILMLPRLFGENELPGSNPTNTSGTSIECNHKYVMLTMGLRPSCTEGTILAYRCQYCGHSYSEQEPAPGHDFVDGVCTRCGEKVMPPDPEDCEHDQDPASCPYCLCDEHVWITSENTATCTEGCMVVDTCIKCGYSYEEWQEPLGHEFAGSVCVRCDLVCEHEYSDVNGGICILCGTECYHVYNEGTCNVVCTLCGSLQGHDYEEIISTDHICTEGNLTTTTCRRCGYSYTETTPAKGHSYESGVCTVCGEVQKTVTVTDSKVAASSVSLLPGQMYSTYPSLQGDGFYGLDPTTTPVYYNVYTYFEGYTITNIRLPVYRAEKGSVFTIRVVKTNNGINQEEIARYTITADRAISRKWVLFSEFSIKVPEGCTLTFGWMSDTLELAMPTSGYIPGYCYWNDYAGSCGTLPLIMDIYGKKTTPPPTPDACEHDTVITGQTPTCTEGCTVKYTCSKCGYSYEQWKDPVVHDYRNGACTMCGRAEAVITAGSANLLLTEKAYAITTAMKVNYYSLANSGAPYYFRSNYYTDLNTLLEGSTVTDIRVAVLSANKGDTLTVSVVRMNGTVPGEPLKTYVLTATEKMERDCLLFSELSIEVPVGYTLTFGASDDTIELIYTDSTSLSHTFASTVRGEFENEYALMIDVYGVRDLDGTLNWMEKLGCPADLLPNAVRPLNASEIDAARLFLNSDARWIITEETFFKPEDIRPYMMFYMGNGTDRLSDGELEALKAIRGDVVIWGDCTKMTDAKLDAYLMQYMGIEMEPSMIGKGLYYLEEYDSYYFFATDANDIGISNLWGWLTEDGNYLLRSTAGYNDFAVLLKPTADGFLIQQVVWINDWIHWVD